MWLAFSGCSSGLQWPTEQSHEMKDATASDSPGPAPSSRPLATFVELLAVALLLGILFRVAIPNYLRAEPAARQMVDEANVRAINSALALYRFQRNGSCPAAGAGFLAFLASTTYFEGGVPVDPQDADGTPDADDYAATYDASLCRVQMSSGPVNHATGAGHD